MSILSNSGASDAGPEMQKQLHRVKCCICNDCEQEVHFEDTEGHTLLKCPDCGLVFLKQYERELDFMDDAADNLENDADKNVEYWSFPSLYEKHKPVFEHFFSDRLEKILRHNPGCKSMLDIGCGYGFWLDYCNKNNLRATGMDVSQMAVQWARENLGVEASTTSFEDYAPEERFDAVVLCDVIEHMPDPVEQLAKIHSLMNDDAVLYVQVPNLLGMSIRRGQGYHLPYHLWQFNLNSMSRLLGKCGFEVLGSHTGVMGVIGVYENGGPGVTDRLIWWISKTLKLGNRLQVIARKRGA